MSYKTKTYSQDLQDSESLQDLGIEKAHVLRAVESLRANGGDVNPNSVAYELGIPRVYIYSDLDLLATIYRNSTSLTGPDRIIQNLIKELKSHQRKLKKLVDQLHLSKAETKKSFSDGFAKGAAMNFTNVQEEVLEVTIDDKWARGLLYIDLDEKLDSHKIKKAYRNMVSMLHPDKTGTESNKEMDLLKRAYEYLLESNSSAFI